MRSTTQRGAEAEGIAAAYLESQGYRIAERNFRAPGGEVDIIAWDEGVLCFVEVRARETDEYGDPLETIDRRKQSRVAKAARHYIETIKGPWPEMRFDAVGVLMTNPPRIELVRDAFEA